MQLVVQFTIVDLGQRMNKSTVCELVPKYILAALDMPGQLAQVLKSCGHNRKGRILFYEYEKNTFG